MFRRISYQNNPLDGVVQHIQNITGEDDIIDSNYSEIIVPSYRTDSSPSSDAKVLFGINNSNYSLFWSSVNNETNKFVFFKLKYSLLLEGIGITNNYIDWYPKYKVDVSNDFISWDSFEISLNEDYFNSNYSGSIYFGVPKSRRLCKFINITPSEEHYDIHRNYAFYGIEFFGELINPYPCSMPPQTGFKSIKYTAIFISLLS